MIPPAEFRPFNVRLRDVVSSIVPVWLSDRPGLNVGFRLLWAIAAVLDVVLEWTVQALIAAWPGLGTPTALPYIGRGRGIVRGRLDTDATFAAKLRAWIATHAIAARQDAVGRAIFDYLGDAQRVRVINRAGHCVTIASDGSVTTSTVAWDWDSVSNPERSTAAAPWWSELWVIVYPDPWASKPVIGEPGSLFAGLVGTGHACAPQDVDAIKGLVAQHKAAHSFVRAIIWTSDLTAFDADTPGSLMPDGTWGNWGWGSHWAPSRPLTCRIWETD